MTDSGNAARPLNVREITLTSHQYVMPVAGRRPRRGTAGAPTTPSAHRHTFPVKLGCVGCAFQFGRTSMWRLGARAALEGFWRRVSQAGRFSPIQRGPLDILLGRWSLDNSPTYLAIDLMSRLFSPYDLNLTGWNPLRKILTEGVEFERLPEAPIKLFITATNVATLSCHAEVSPTKMATTRVGLVSCT